MLFSSLQLEENSVSASNRLYLKSGLQKSYIWPEGSLCVFLLAH